MMRLLVNRTLCAVLLIGHLAASRVAASDTAGMVRIDTFRMFMESQSDPLAIIAAESQWRAYMLQLATEEQLNLPLAERVHNIRALFQQSLLREYRDNARFGEMFATGTYNCVTATALYALTFAQLSIPYEIRELPQHVLLIVSPRRNAIILETTDQREGVYFPMPYSAKYNYVSYLYERGQISESDYRQMGTSELFDKYFFARKKLTITQLLGIYYGNTGMYAYESGLYPQAVAAFQAALPLYPGERMRFHLEMALEQHLTQSELETAADVALLQTYAALQPAGRKRDRVLAAATVSLAETWLIGRNNEAQFQQLMMPLRAAFARHPVLEGSYQRELTRARAMQGRYEEAMVAADSALLLQPENLENQEAVLQIASSYLRYSPDLGRAHEWLVDLALRYPFLRQSPAFADMTVIALIGAAEDAFRRDDPASGWDLLEQARINAPAQFSPALAQAFSAGAACWVRLGQLPLAVEALKTALELAPQDAGLQQRLASLADW